MEAIQKIRQIEAEGKKGIKDAEKGEGARCRKASLEVEQKLAKARSEIEREIETKFKKMREETEKEIRSISKKYEKEKEELKRLVSKNRKKAVSFIKKKILGD